MSKRLQPQEIARRRVIERLELSKGRGVIVANGRTFEIVYDDVLDLVQAVEMIMIKLTGKVLSAKLRPVIRNRAALMPDVVVGGEHDGSGPVPRLQWCDVTGQYMKTHVITVAIGGSKWENWVCRLDELMKCLYIIVREAQGDPYVPRPAVFMGDVISA